MRKQRLGCWLGSSRSVSVTHDGDVDAGDSGRGCDRVGSECVLKVEPTACPELLSVQS